MLCVKVNNETMNISWGHFANLCEEIVEWCREHTAKDEDDRQALAALERYKICDYSIKPENARLLYLMMTRENEEYTTLQEHLHEWYEEDDFFYNDTFVICTDKEAHYNWHTATSTIGTSCAGKTLDNFIKCDRLIGWKKLDASEEEYADYNAVCKHIQDNATKEIVFDFSEPERGVEDAWISRFINLVGMAAIKNCDIVFC